MSDNWTAVHVPSSSPMEVWRRFNISCAHFLPGHPKCGRMHGHNYSIELGIVGPVVGGMVIDFSLLKEIFQACVGNGYDHKTLNDIPGLEMPTAEVMAFDVAVRMTRGLEHLWPVHLCAVRIYETPDCCVELRLK